MANALKSFIYLPIAFLVFLGVGILICYGIALSYGHVQSVPQWPFVSDAGATPPESGIFGLFLTWGAFTLLVTAFTYYKYVIYQNRQSKRNVAALIVACITCFCMTMVGSFQWDNEGSLVPHVIGAFGTFIGGLVYSWLVIAVSWSQLVPDIHSKKIVFWRIAIASMETISCAAFIVLTTLNVVEQGKYRSAAAISQWVVVYSALLFIATLIYDLRNVGGVKVLLALNNETPTPAIGNDNSAFDTSKMEAL